MATWRAFFVRRIGCNRRSDGARLYFYLSKATRCCVVFTYLFVN